jgi:hypothetical protein
METVIGYPIMQMDDTICQNLRSPDANRLLCYPYHHSCHIPRSVFSSTCSFHQRIQCYTSRRVIVFRQEESQYRLASAQVDSQTGAGLTARQIPPSKEPNPHVLLRHCSSHVTNGHHTPFDDVFLVHSQPKAS